MSNVTTEIMNIATDLGYDGDPATNVADALAALRTVAGSGSGEGVLMVELENYDPEIHDALIGENTKQVEPTPDQVINITPTEVEAALNNNKPIVIKSFYEESTTSTVFIFLIDSYEHISGGPKMPEMFKLKDMFHNIEYISYDHNGIFIYIENA